MRTIQLFLLLCIFLCVNKLLAQENSSIIVRPLSASSVNYPITNVYIWAAGSYENIGDIFVSKSYKGRMGDLHCSYVNVGCGTEMRGISFDLGYRLGLYTYDVGLTDNSGVYTHSLSLDIGAGTYLWFGVKANYLLGTHTNNDNQSGYEGLNEDCFRRFNWGLYYGYRFGLTNYTVGARFVWWFTKPLVADKVAFYNMEYTRLDLNYGIELMLSYRLFSNGQRRINSSHYIGD